MPEMVRKVTFDPKAVYNFELEKTLDEKVLLKKLCKGNLKRRTRGIKCGCYQYRPYFRYDTWCRDHQTDPEQGCRTTHVVINCHGAGGQSFGAFIPKGLTLESDR